MAKENLIKEEDRSLFISTRREDQREARYRRITEIFYRGVGDDV